HEMMTGVRLFQAKNDIAKMRELLAKPIPLPSSINAAVPRELDRIVMKALDVDPTQRYQTTAAMASDLERTMIAARHSSRDLAKLLRGIFMPGDEDPSVVVEAAAPAPADPRPTGSMPSMRSSTQEISNTERTRSSRTQSTSGVLDGALRAEQSRLLQQKRTTQFKALLVLAVLGGLSFVGVKAWKPYISPLVTDLLKEPPPPPPPPNPPTPPADLKPAPAPAVPKSPPKKKPLKRGKAGSESAPVRAGTGDDVIAPSE